MHHNYVNFYLLREWESYAPESQQKAKITPPKIKFHIPTSESFNSFAGIPNLEEHSLSDIESRDPFDDVDYTTTDKHESKVRSQSDVVEPRQNRFVKSLSYHCSLTSSVDSGNKFRYSMGDEMVSNYVNLQLYCSAENRISASTSNGSSLALSESLTPGENGANGGLAVGYSSEEEMPGSPDNSSPRKFRAASTSSSKSTLNSTVNKSGLHLQHQTPVNPTKFWLPGTSRSSSGNEIQPRVLFQENNYGNFGVSRKAGWLEVKYLLCLRKRKLEPVTKRKFRRFWACLKGTKLLLYNDPATSGPDSSNALPVSTICLDNCLVQALPEHPRRENVIVTSNSYGDVFMLQCGSIADMNSWTYTIHKACGHALALKKDTEDTINALKMDIERKEKICNSKTSASSNEIHFCDIFRLRCYIASLRNDDLPNPKSLLCLVTKETKAQLSRINCFSVCAVHALLSASSLPLPKPQGSLERPKRSMFSLLRSRDSILKRDDSKINLAKRRNSHAGRIGLTDSSPTVNTLDDSIICSPASRNEELAIWDHRENGKLARISLPRNQTTVMRIEPHTTVLALLDHCCRRRSLDPNDHFIRIRQADEWTVPRNNSLISNHICEAIELCVKEYSSVNLEKSHRDETYGFSFEVKNDQENTRMFILDVIPGSQAQEKGLSRGDEIVEMGKHCVSSADQALIDFNLRKKDSLALVVRSLRPSATCDSCGKRLDSTTDHPNCPTISSPIPQSDLQKLGKTCQELFYTELHYKKDLTILLRDYLSPIINSQIFSENLEITQLLDSTRKMQTIQEEFLSQFQSFFPTDYRLQSSTIQEILPMIAKIMNTFLQFVDKFKIYGVYCALHRTAWDTFRDASLEPNFKKVLEEINPRNEQARNLQSYLIKPMQRVLKYKLFIGQISGLIPDTLTEYTDEIKTAYKEIDQLGVYINELQKVYEDYCPLFEQMLMNQTCSQISSLPLDELLAHGAVTWMPNTVDESSGRKEKGHPMLLFVFKSTLILIPNFREKKKRKSIVAQSKFEEPAAKQKFLLPTCTCSPVPAEFLDDAEHFAIDFSECQQDNPLTQRFVFWSKEGSLRDSLSRAIQHTCAPSTQMRKRNARRLLKSPTLESAHLTERTPFLPPPALPATPPLQSRSRSPSPLRRNTQVDSGVFSDDNENPSTS